MKAISPVFTKEMISLSRRKRHYVMRAGFLGVPRRTARVGYGGEGPVDWNAPLNLVGVGAGIAAAGGALFIVVMVMTLLRGERTDDPARLAPSGTVA